MNMQFKSICVALALVAAPITAQAIAITYDIGSGSAPNFSGSWLHAATDEMGSSGYFANGDKAGIEGSLTLVTDGMGNYTGASGFLTGSGDVLGFGSDEDWTIDILDGSSSTSALFIGGDSLLLSLDYHLTSIQGHDTTGTFYFATHDFNNTANDGSANFITPTNLVLWGNNWINENGRGDRAIFAGPDGLNTGLGLDLFGTITDDVDVPEPGVLALLAMGLIGMGVSRRKLRS